MSYFLWHKCTKWRITCLCVCSLLSDILGAVGKVMHARCRFLILSILTSFRKQGSQKQNLQLRTPLSAGSTVLLLLLYPPQIYPKTCRVYNATGSDLRCILGLVKCSHKRHVDVCQTIILVYIHECFKKIDDGESELFFQNLITDVFRMLRMTRI